MKNKKGLCMNRISWATMGLLLGILISCTDNEQVAIFSSLDNINIPYQKKHTIRIKVAENKVEQIQLQIEDSIVKTWKNTVKNQELSYTINTTNWGLGAKTMQLLATKNNGKTTSDQRKIIVISDVQPQLLDFHIVNTFSHNVNNFTQGLEFDGDQLYESTGQLGESKIAKINIETGEDIARVSLESAYFGEGITILGDTIYQLTWTSNKCFLYNKNTLEQLTESFTYRGEGWGICNNGKQLITSDGSEQLTFRNPKTFEIEKIIHVYTHQQAVTRLNELEFIDGYIFANIWMTNNIAVIDPLNGRVIGVMNGNQLVSLGRGKVGDSFNGIAYNKKQKSLYLTGKNWEKLFQVALANFPFTSQEQVGMVHL